jgi:hypothetical protein
MWHEIYCVIIAVNNTTYLLFCKMVACTLVGHRWVCAVNTFSAVSATLWCHIKHSLGFIVAPYR